MKSFFQKYITNNIPIPPPNPEDYVEDIPNNKLKFIGVQPPSPIIVKSEEYVKETPKFKIGDIVKVNSTSLSTQSIGNIGKIIRIDENLTAKNIVQFNNYNASFMDSSLDLAEIPKFNVGDRVKIINCSFYTNHIGKLASIIDNTTYYKLKKYVINIDFKKLSYVYDEIDLEKVEEVPKETKFKSGDRVRIKITDNVGTIKDFEISSVTKKIIYKTKLDKDNVDRYFYEDSLIKIDEEKEQFKIGDIVQINSDNAIHNKEYGIILEQYKNIDLQEISKVDIGSNYYYYKSIESLKKIDIYHPNKDEIERGSFVQVKGNRHKFSKRFGIVGNNLSYGDCDIDFGNDKYTYHKKNLKLIK
jgi:ribosomal protein S17